MHVHRGQQIHHIRTASQGNPVELNVVAGGEVSHALDQWRRLDAAHLLLRVLRTFKQRRVGLVVLARNAGNDAQLPR